MTGGVRFLFVKKRFGKRKPKEKPGTEPVRENGSGEKPSIEQLRQILREHLLIRQLVALFADSVKKVLVLPERYYLDVDLTGGFQSPDITGQVYGLVQVGRSIPSDALSLAYDPDFTADRIQGTITIGSVLKAYKLIILLIIIAWRLPKIKLIKMYRKFKKGGRHV